MIEASFTFTEIGIIVMISLGAYIIGCFQGVNYSLREKQKQNKDR